MIQDRIIAALEVMLFEFANSHNLEMHTPTVVDHLRLYSFSKGDRKYTIKADFKAMDNVYNFFMNHTTDMKYYFSEFDVASLYPKYFIPSRGSCKSLLNANYGMCAFDIYGSGGNNMKIEKVIFNDPATIILWNDGSKTIVKCMEGEEYDAEKGLAMALCKKYLGDDFRKTFKKYLKEYEEQEEKKFEVGDRVRVLKVDIYGNISVEHVCAYDCGQCAYMRETISNGIHCKNCYYKPDHPQYVPRDCMHCKSRTLSSNSRRCAGCYGTKTHPNFTPRNEK